MPSFALISFVLVVVVVLSVKCVEEESISSKRTRMISKDPYARAGITYYSHRAKPPEGPHVAVFIHAITEYIMKQLHDKLPRRGLLVLEEMLDEIKDSGLLEKADRIYVSMLGAVIFESWFDQAVRIVSRFNVRGSRSRAKVVFLMDDVDVEEGKVGYVYWEYPTLRAMQLYAAAAHPQSALLYIHTKAVTKKRRTLQLLGDNGWRRFLTYGLVWNYNTCVEAIMEYGFATCGSQLDHEPFPHYVGNMFFTSAWYYRSTKPLTWLEWRHSDRYYAERHLLEGNPPKKPFDTSQHYCMVFIAHGFYDCPTPRYLYDDPSYYKIIPSSLPGSASCAYVRNLNHQVTEQSWDITDMKCVVPSFNPVHLASEGGWYYISKSDDDWIGDIYTDGWGHRPIFEWLTELIRPRLVVDVSGDDGYISCIFAQKLADLAAQDELLRYDEDGLPEEDEQGEDEGSYAYQHYRYRYRNSHPRRRYHHNHHDDRYHDRDDGDSRRNSEEQAASAVDHDNNDDDNDDNDDNDHGYSGTPHSYSSSDISSSSSDSSDSGSSSDRATCSAADDSSPPPTSGTTPSHACSRTTSSTSSSTSTSSSSSTSGGKLVRVSVPLLGPMSKKNTTAPIRRLLIKHRLQQFAMVYDEATLHSYSSSYFSSTASSSSSSSSSSRSSKRTSGSTASSPTRTRPPQPSSSAAASAASPASASPAAAAAAAETIVDPTEAIAAATAEKDEENKEVGATTSTSAAHSSSHNRYNGNNLRHNNNTDTPQQQLQQPRQNTRWWPHGEIDILIINGETDSASVESYLRKFLPLLHPGGVVLLPGVLALHEKVGVHRVFANDSLWTSLWPTTGSRTHSTSTAKILKGFVRESFGLGVVTANAALFNQFIGKLGLQFTIGALQSLQWYPMSTHYKMNFFELPLGDGDDDKKPNTASPFSTDYNGETVVRKKRFAYMEWKMLDGSMMYPKIEIRPANYVQVITTGMLKDSIYNAVASNVALKSRLGLLSSNSAAADAHSTNAHNTAPDEDAQQRDARTDKLPPSYVFLPESDVTLLVEYLRRDIVRTLVGHLAVDEEVLVAMAQIAPWCSVADLLVGAVAKPKNDSTSSDGSSGRSSSGRGSDSSSELVMVPLHARVSQHYLESICADQAKALSVMMKEDADAASAASRYNS